MPDLIESAVADPEVVAVRQVLDAIARAMHDRDAAAVARYFARDATLADPPRRCGGASIPTGCSGGSTAGTHPWRSRTATSR
jgi:ketosteroid isomerase-like protein